MQCPVYERLCFELKEFVSTSIIEEVAAVAALVTLLYYCFTLIFIF